jgi:thiol-disulfide isomerase/thioredoxin
MYIKMPSIIDVMFAPIEKYYRLILIVFCLIIFIFAGYKAYQMYGVPWLKKKPINDVANANKDAKAADIYFFNVDWCPHCIKAKPEWDKFVETHNGKTINNYTIHTHNVDCTDDVKSAAVIAKYDIKGYPTTKMTLDGGDTVEFDSKMTTEGLAKFADTVLNE